VTIRETDLVEGHTVLNQQRYSGIKETDVALEHEVLFGLGRDASLEVPQAFLGWKRVGPETCGKHQKECGPLANSSSTSASCSAAILNKAVTLYRFVFLFVRRRTLPGEPGSVNVDMGGDWEGNLQSWPETGICQPRVQAFCSLAKAKEGGSGEYDT